MDNNLIVEYETEFVNLLHTVQLQVSDDDNSTNFNTDSNPMDNMFTELNDLLDQIDIEINNVADKQTWRAKLRQYKTEYQTAKSLYDTKYKEQRERALLFGDNNNNMNDTQRQQLLSNHHLLNDTHNKLQDATRIALDTEQIGSQIMNNLRSQRETIENSHQNLSQVDSQLDKSLQTLRQMTHRLLANKFISYAIIAVLILLIFCVIYSKF